MANKLFDKTLQLLGTGGLDLSSGTFKLTLVDHGVHTPDTSDTGDDYIDDIPAGARKQTVTLSGVTFVNRVFDASDVNPLTDPGGGTTVESFVIWKDTGTESTSPLIYFIDTDSGGLLPYTLDGNDDQISWNASGIFKLGA